MKKRLGSIAALFGAAAMLAAGAASARELRYATAAPAPTPWGKAADGFAALVGQLSGGSLTIKVFPSNQLGEEQAVVRQVARGRIDLIGASNTATSLLVPEVGLLAAPYLFDNVGQADCAYDKLAAKFEPALAEAGAVNLAWVEVGHQIVITKEKMATTPAAIAGEKIRSAPTASDTLFLREAGLSPVPLTVGEAAQGLQTGAVNGATFPTVFAVAAGFTKMAPQISVTNHVHQIGTVLISKRVWDTLSAEEQGWLREAADKAFASLRQGIREAEVGLLQKAAAEGATVHHPTEAEMAEWRAAAKNAYPKIVADYGGNSEAVWAEIQQAKAACAN